MGCDCKLCECKIRETVISEIKSYMENEKLEVTVKSNITSLGLDSLDIVEFRMQVEDKFGIDLKEHEMDKVHIVQDLINLIYSKSR